ncbi:MAG: hypothetical protein LLG04_04275 [Parachlamydia sp.]|nr:hypothetical protein [Parachlamydia sp.]
MRDEFVADVGDFGKYILLNELSTIINGQHKIGINWYYNRRPAGAFRYLYDKNFEAVYPHLHGMLRVIAEDTAVSLERIQTDSILRDGFIHYRDEIPYKAKTRSKRKSEREEWFKRSRECLQGANIIFLDPDNGIPYPEDNDIGQPRIKKGEMDAIKYAFADEIMRYYAKGKSVVVYNHRDFKSEDEYQSKFLLLKDYLPLSGRMPVLRFVRFQVRDYLIIPQACHKDIFKQLVGKLTKNPFDFLFTSYDI